MILTLTGVMVMAVAVGLTRLDAASFHRLLHSLF
jgi:hypothetical protein